MAFPERSNSALATAAGQPPRPTTTSSYSAETVELSERLLVRLTVLRARIDGSGASSDKERAPVPNCVLPMVATTHTNLSVAHKMLDEIDELIG